jgi:hypothetical protein
VTRRIFAAAVACAALAAPAGALAQDPTTVPTTTIAPGAATTVTPGATVTQPGATTTTPPATTTTTAPPAVQPAAPVTTTPAAAPSSGRHKAAILLLLVVVFLLLSVLVLAGAAHWQAWDPPWLQRWRHASAEAGWRANNAWGEFTDWLRLGR